MKILLVIDQFNSENNGTTISTVRFAQYLANIGHDVRVLTTGKEGKNMYIVPERKIPLATHFAHKQGMVFGKPVKSILTKAISECDIVHFLMPWAMSKKGIKICKKLNKPYTAAFHVQPENISYNIGMSSFPWFNTILYHYFRLRFYKNVNHIHCPSQFIANELRRNHYKGKLHVVSNGIDKKFVPPTNRNTNKEKFVITMVGRLSKEKRQDILINAVNMSKYRDKIQLVFAGRGPKANYYEKLSKKLPNAPIFGFYSQKDLIDLLQSSDLYVHPADVEIEAISCIEAFATGLVPIISNSLTSATKQFALDERSLFKHGDARDLANKIDYWLDNQEEREKMSSIYAKYANEFRLDKCILKIDKMFKEAIEDFAKE